MLRHVSIQVSIIFRIIQIIVQVCYSDAIYASYSELFRFVLMRLYFSEVCCNQIHDGTDDLVFNITKVFKHIQIYLF